MNYEIYKKIKTRVFFVQMKVKQFNNNSRIAASVVQYSQIKIRNIDDELFTCE